MFATIRTALKLAGTVVDLNERLTALEANFDILDRAFKRREAQVRAENSRARKIELEQPSPAIDSGLVQAMRSEGVIGGIMKRKQENDGR